MEDDNPYAVKNESEPTKDGERWEDIQKGRKLTTRVTDGDDIEAHYDDGEVAGPFPRQEWEENRDHFRYLGRED